MRVYVQKAGVCARVCLQKAGVCVCVCAQKAGPAPPAPWAHSLIAVGLAGLHPPGEPTRGVHLGRPSRTVDLKPDTFFFAVFPGALLCWMDVHSLPSSFSGRNLLKVLELKNPLYQRAARLPSPGSWLSSQNGCPLRVATLSDCRPFEKKWPHGLR